MLELRQLEKRYPGGDHALKGVSLSVGAGEVLDSSVHQGPASPLSFVA